MTERTCPACLGPMPPPTGRGRPRRWCSGRCKGWVSMLGGPLEAAELMEHRGRMWASYARATGNRGYRETAQECEAIASALRAVAEGA